MSSENQFNRQNFYEENAAFYERAAQYSRNELIKDAAGVLGGVAAIGAGIALIIKGDLAGVVLVTTGAMPVAMFGADARDDMKMLAEDTEKAGYYRALAG